MFQHIDYKTKISRWARELLDTDPNQVMKYGWKNRDDKLWWIFGWELLVVWWESGIGKSTFINQICTNVSNQWFRVVKYSLENRLEASAKEELFYTINRIRRSTWRAPYVWWPFIANEYSDKWKLADKDYEQLLKAAFEKLSKVPIIELDKDRWVTIQDMVKLMEEEIANWTKLFVIDHLHYFVFEDSDRLDLQIKNVMHDLNELARKHNIAIIIVAHYRWITGWEKWRDMVPNPNYFRDWCFTGDTLVYDKKTNKRYSMLELYNYKIPCTLDVMDYKTQQKKEYKDLIINDTGKKNIYKITLSNGTEVKASENSRLWMLDWWRYVKDLKEWNYIWYSNRWIYEWWNFNQWLLYGLLLSNWYMWDDMAITLPTMEWVNKLLELLKEFWAYRTIRDEINKKTWLVTSYTVKIRYGRPNKLKDELRRLWLFKKVAHEKFIPDERLLWWKQFVNWLLQWLFEWDGSYSDHTLSYATTSIKLATWIKYLLSQMWIESSILYTKWSVKKIFWKDYNCKKSYRVCVTRICDIVKFLNEIWFMTSKNKQHIDKLDMSWGRWSDYLPVEINDIILKYRKEWNYSRERMWYRVQQPHTCMPVRESIRTAGENMKSDELLLYANSCLSYTKITNIEYLWEEDTYDFEVPWYWNFFLDNWLLVHNSSIKQVAHKIIQIVRDEDPKDSEKEITIFYFTKFRWPIQNIKFEATFDSDMYEYSFWEATVINKIINKEDDDEEIF